MRYNYTFIKISKMLDAFYHSSFYIALVTLVAVLGFALKQEIVAIFIIGSLAAVGWIFVKDFTHTVLSIIMISMVPLARYNQQAYFAPLYYLPIILVPALVLHIINFPLKKQKAAFLIPTLAVAISITLGGLFYLKAEEYFTMPALYYVIGLGFGMVLMYLFFNSSITCENFMIAEYFSKLMVGVGIMGICMVLTKYIEIWEFIFTKSLLTISCYFQWGNNLSNMLLIAMPFSFYLSAKGRHTVAYFCIGILEYLAMLFTLSRGGMIFSTIEIPLLIMATLIVSKSNRKKMIIPTLIFIALGIYIAYKLAPQILKVTEVTGDEARVKMYKHAWESFLQYPVFGKGLAYDPGKYYYPKPMCIYWYHSTLFQVLGSLGAVGIASYLVQFIYRAKTLLKVRSKFNLFFIIAMIGFGGYSMVNVGYFVPFPCVLVLWIIFTIADRYNKYLLTNKNEMANEALFKAKIKNENN